MCCLVAWNSSSSAEQQVTPRLTHLKAMVAYSISMSALLSVWPGSSWPVYQRSGHAQHPVMMLPSKHGPKHLHAH